MLLPVFRLARRSGLTAPRRRTFASGLGPVSRCACPLPGSGLAAPRRRTFAPGIPALRSLRAACAFALLSCASRRGRLPWYGQPLAEAVDDSRAADGPWMASCHSTRRRRMRRQRRQKTLGVFCRRPRGKGHGWRIAIRRGVAGCDAHQAKKGHGWLFLRSSQCGRKVWRIVTWRT